MNWYMYSADIRVTGAAQRAVEQRHACGLCDSKLERLAWRDSAPPWHWKPFGWICSVCNAVYVTAESRIVKAKPPRRKHIGEYGLAEPLAPSVGRATAA